jgi:acetyl/propionyl-CoA carboxylase alpha subunit
VIGKLLVANRGEIALRVFRTCERLGIATVAVVAPDDLGSLHARRAGETVEIASYLDGAEHVRAALETGADAIHPGYGFLAESADFAGAVTEAGLRFVGPSAAALRRGADKLAAKRAADRAGVPVLPAGNPDEIGYPLVVKAAAGGGGRGMRVVRDARELEEAVAAARREAAAAFGDDAVFYERFLERPRHVEVQLLADAHGNAVAFPERDCSVQRRHQKVLEESPSPGVGPAIRARLADAALAFGRAVGYEGAGTAEFLLEDDGFFFLELNGRIQVEHPVTELVTGIDLVQAQLEIAAGAILDLAEPTPAGHAIEVRLCAEDPRSFLPQGGHLARFRLPDGVRVDSGFEEGDDVGLRYDSLLAKLVAHGPTREEARRRLVAALDEAEVGGVVTNLAFLRWLVRHPVFRAGEATIAFLQEHPPVSEPAARVAPAPWRGGFRLNLPPPPRTPPPDAGAHHAHTLHGEDGAALVVTAPMPGTVLRVEVAEGAWVGAHQALLVLEAMKMETPVAAPGVALVRRVLVRAGDTVAAGAPLVELSEDGEDAPPA